MKTRLFVSRDLINGTEAVLDGDRARYLGRVLRLRVGDAITVFDGSGAEWAASIAAMTRNTATLELGESHEPAMESPLRIHLVQGISRGERMDYVVQKATELGVARITPVLTEHGVVKLDGQRAAKRREHWERLRTVRTHAPAADRGAITAQALVRVEAGGCRPRPDPRTRCRHRARPHCRTAHQGLHPDRTRGWFQRGRIRGC